VASPIYHQPPAPPGIYRAARALRRLSTIVLVLIIVFVAVVAYSALQVVKTHPRVGTSTEGYEPNDTVGISTSLTLSNPTYFAIQQFALEFRIVNDSGVTLVDSTTGAATIAAGASETIPINLYVPITASDASLLTENQYLQWDVWGNASYAYLFAVSIGVETNRSWGAPFDDLAVTVGTPMMTGGTVEVPVTLSFANDATFADTGDLNFQLVPTAGPDCAQGSFALNVPAQGNGNDNNYDQTQNVALATGCNPAGGYVSAEFVGDGFVVPFTPEPIP
jgi:hypothetical protein